MHQLQRWGFKSTAVTHSYPCVRHTCTRYTRDQREFCWHTNAGTHTRQTINTKGGAFLTRLRPRQTHANCCKMFSKQLLIRAALLTAVHPSALHSLAHTLLSHQKHWSTRQQNCCRCESLQRQCSILKAGHATAATAPAAASNAPVHCRTDSKRQRDSEQR